DPRPGLPSLSLHTYADHRDPHSFPTRRSSDLLAAKADADAKLSDKDRENVRKKDKTAVFLDKDSPQFQEFMNQSEQRIVALYKRSEEHTSELQSLRHLVCRLLLEKKNPRHHCI